MYNEKDQDVYYLHKLLIGLMYDNNYDTYKTMPWIYDVDVLEVFRELIIEFVNQNCIAKHIKDNINKILVDGRDIRDENYERRIEVINEIITILNKQERDLSVVFYYGELKARRKDDKLLKKYTVQDVINESPYIDESMYNDFLVLLSHGNDTKEGTFLIEYLPDFVNNAYYYESLNVILEECPSMFKNELFAKRVNMILNENKKVDKEFKTSHKQIKQLVKKYI